MSWPCSTWKPYTGHAPCQHVHDVLTRRLTDLDAQIEGLQALRATVSQLHDKVASAGPDTNGTGCRYL